MTHRVGIASWTAAAAVLTLAAASCGGSRDAGVSNDPGKAGTAAPASAASGAPAPPPASGHPGPAAPGGAAAKGPAVPENPVPAGVDPKKPVATVNGAAISADRAYSVYQLNKSMIEQRGRILSETDQQGLRAQTLNNLIAEELLYQGATAAGITVGPADVDARLKDIRTRAGSEEAFKKMMDGSGMTEPQIRVELERGLKTELYEKSVATAKKVDEKTARQFYDEHKDGFKIPEQAHVQYILLKAAEKDPESVRNDAKARAEEARSKASSGADFATLAKQYSQDATAAKGGDVAFFPRGVMFPTFEQMAFTLPPGSVSPVFETPKGFNVMKVLERKPESIRPFDDVKSGLMIDMGQLVGQKLVQDKVNELAAKAKIEILDPAFKAPPPPPQTAASGAQAGTPPAAVKK